MSAGVTMKRLEVPAVVLVDPKYSHNVGAAIRALSCFGVSTLFWTGTRVTGDEYERLPREERMKGYAAVNWQRSERPFDALPVDCTPVCVDLFEHSEPLTTFEHPARPVYVFGPEDGAVPPAYRTLCHRFVHIPSFHCLNLSAAVNVLLYDRLMKRQLVGEEPILPLNEMLHEHRGEITAAGWNGQ